MFCGVVAGDSGAVAGNRRVLQGKALTFKPVFKLENL
jgi:hypothetical protein